MPRPSPDDSSDSPRALPPPVIYGGCLLLGLGLDRLWPWRLLDPAPRRALGGALLALGLALGLWALAAFVRFRTSPLLHRPARDLITTGAFRYSRNPAYLALCLLYAGTCVWLGNAWGLFLLAPAALLTDRYVIRREEEYLARRFGEKYLRYRSRVRRWV